MISLLLAIATPEWVEGREARQVGWRKPQQWDHCTSTQRELSQGIKPEYQSIVLLALAVLKVLLMTPLKPSALSSETVQDFEADSTDAAQDRLTGQVCQMMPTPVHFI